MKNMFNLNESIGRMMVTSGYDTDKLINAVQSAKNDGTLLNDPDATAKDSGVKLASKGAEAKWNVAKREEYSAKTNDPLRFASWNDSLASHFKKCGEPHAELTDAILPASLYIWLEKFRVKPATDSGTGKPQGKARTNGNVDKVQTPAPAGASK
jgi:hypothetical protein